MCEREREREKRDTDMVATATVSLCWWQLWKRWKRGRGEDWRKSLNTEAWTKLSIRLKPTLTSLDFCECRTSRAGGNPEKKKRIVGWEVTVGLQVFAPSYKPRDPLRSPPRMNETGFRVDPPTIVLQINEITDCTSGLQDESRTYVTETPACIHITSDPDYISHTRQNLQWNCVYD